METIGVGGAPGFLSEEIKGKMVSQYITDASGKESLKSLITRTKTP